jgi:hypothetical protein
LVRFPLLFIHGLYSDETNDVSAVKTWLSETTVQQVLIGLLTLYFPLSASELACWQEDPDTFLSDEEADSWEYQLRPSAEKLLMDLVATFKSTIIPHLMTQFNQAVHLLTLAVPRLPELSQMLLLDAVLNAVGLAAHWLFEVFDFDAFFRVLLPVLHLNQEHAIAVESIASVRILRRRAAWLSGHWVKLHRFLALNACRFESSAVPRHDHISTCYFQP